ncbi:hypothetical protein FOZ62_025717 [Perkinsus olseni]|nr:hypothetical protein FOZ62_025717 [Perkinsus olseni]
MSVNVATPEATIVKLREMRFAGAVLRFYTRTFSYRLRRRKLPTRLWSYAAQLPWVDVVNDAGAAHSVQDVYMEHLHSLILVHVNKDQH